jgi:hypothetical protein
MLEKEVGWFARSILGAAGVGVLLGLAYLVEPTLVRICVAMILALAAFSISAFTMLALFPSAVRIALLPILTVAGGLGGLVFSFSLQTSRPWSIAIGCLMGLAIPLVLLLRSEKTYSAGNGGG